MLQDGEIEQRFHIIGYVIGQAAQACSAERDVPSELRDCIQKMDRQSDLAREVVGSRDEARIRKMVDELELLGARARRVCGSRASLTEQMKNAVLRVHDEVSDLKRQLH